MYTQTQISFGEALKQQGITTAVDHANAVVENWTDKACTIADAYLQAKPFGYNFQIEDIRMFAEKHSLLQTPPSRRAWACLKKYLIKNELAKIIGSKPVKNPLAHGALASLWMKL